jgi:hypothetical protein
MIGTLRTLRPTNLELEKLNVLEVDALGVVFIDLPDEIQVMIG